jgi:hypothetical protein
MRTLLRPRAALFATMAGAALLAAGCSNPPSSADSPVTTETTGTSGAPLQRLELTYEQPIVGALVTATATGLPAGQTAELEWRTVTGGWVIEDYYYFRGKQYTDSTLPLGTFPIDQDGRLDAEFAIPEDYGGVHEIVAMVDGAPVAQNGIEVTQTFEMTPASGPVGTLVEIKVTGLGWRTMESTWVVNWDNGEVGWVSAASSRGSAVARFRATGPPGDHMVKLYTGWQGQPYLNYEQSPVAHLPRPEFVFRTTPGRAPMPAAYAEPYQPQPVPATELSLANAALSLSPTQGPVGTRAALNGSGFPAGATLALVWQTYVGNRVSGEGFAPYETPIGELTVGSDGRIDHAITIPDDLGGLHGIALRHGDEQLALAHFVTETSIVSMTPSSGPAGTPVTIHLKGVGWTEYDNIYVATYDNSYMGYACGFNSAGDVVINFTAAGAPGIHLIDFYPGIYQGPPDEPQNLYRTPQLTYADDHPGNTIPALRFAFEVTPSPPRGTE